MKSGQVYSQALIYIFTLVLVSIIIVYGYNAISNFRSMAAEVSMLKLRNDISNSIKEMASEYNSEKLTEFPLPDNIKRVCFIETYDTTLQDSDLNFDVIIKDSVANEFAAANNDIEKIKKIKNVFLMENVIKDSFNVPIKIIVEDGLSSPNDEVICKENIGGRFSLKIIGKGDGVTLS